MNFGQTCHAGTRIYVHEDVYDEFLAKFTKTMANITVGHPFEKSTNQGPQNSQMQYDKIFSYIEAGKQDGAKCILGGEKRPGKGYYVDPTSKRPRGFRTAASRDGG